MVLAAGLGTRLRPLTYEVTKPMVPVLDRPVMEHILDLLDRHSFGPVIANLHYFAQTIREHFGERISYRYEPELLGTAGGVRGCADFFGGASFLVISGDALTDIDLRRFAERHRQAGGIATLAVKRVPDTREYGVVLHDREGRVTGFQEKPAPEEALSELGNCGIYMFEPEIFDYFPERPFVDWAQDVFPTLLEHDVPFHIHALHAYWNDVGSLGELRRGTFDALAEVLADRLGEIVEVGDHRPERVPVEQIKDVLHHRPVEHRHHRLSDLIGERAQPRAEARGENHRSHRRKSGPLVAVVIGLVGAIHGHADVRRLLLAQPREPDAERV